MGAERDASFTVDAAGYALADGGFNATLRDYARFGLMHLNGGFANQRQIVPGEWIDDIFNANPALPSFKAATLSCVTMVTKSSSMPK